MNPDGSSPEPVSFSIGKDTTGNAMANKAAPPYTSIGYTGCAIDTLQCGPNDENGRGLFATGLLGGVPWLVLAGSRQSGDVEYIYMTNGTGTTLALSWIDLDGPLTDETRGLAAMHVFGDRLYLGFSQAGGNRPILGRLETLPSPPGYNAVAPTNFVDLLAGDMPDIGASAQLSLIDVIGDFNDRLYVANNGGWMRATTATPTPYGTGMDNGWTSTRPTSTDYTAKTSVTTAKSADYEPSDRAVPQLATLNGRYYAARNTTTGPQLWMCDPTLTGGAMDCDPADWTLIARNTLGDTRASQFNASGNAAITLLVATATHLYVGYNNAAGLELWRSTAPLPTQLADFEGANGCPANLHATSCAPLGGQGLGDATNNTRIFAGVVASFNGRDNVYLVSGSGNNGVRVVRIAE